MLILQVLLLALLQLISLCSYLDLNYKPDSSLITTVSEALKIGAQCRTIVEQYQLKIFAPFINFYDDSLAVARILDEINNDKKIVKGNLHCVPLIIWDNENDIESDKITPVFDFFKRRGAIAIGKLSSKSFSSVNLKFPSIIVKFGLSEDDAFFGKRIRYSTSTNDSTVTRSHSLTFRLNSYRETVTIASGRLNDIKILSNCSDVENKGIKWKKVGFVSRGFSFLKIQERSANVVYEKLIESGAVIKNVTVNSNEMSSILRQLRNLLPCNPNLPTRNDSTVEFTGSGSTVLVADANADLRCWTTTKKRYRYQIRFVKRIIEPLFGSNDFLAIPTYGDQTDENSDYGRFMYLLSQSYYPTVEYNPVYSSALEPVVFVARPDQFSSLLNVALTFEDLLKDNKRNGNEVVSHYRSKQEIMDGFQPDYCGKLLLSGVVAGKPVFAYDLCGPKGLCINTPTGIKCECAPGYSGRFCQESKEYSFGHRLRSGRFNVSVSPPFTIVQKCVLYPTYQTVVNNLTAACPDQTTCVPYAHHCLFNYCDNPHGWCLAMDEFASENSQRH